MGAKDRRDVEGKTGERGVGVERKEVEEKGNQECEQIHRKHIRS